MPAKLFVRSAFATILACSLLGSLPASAQEPSATSVAMAKEVIVLKGGNVLFERIVPGVIESAKNNYLPTNPNLGKELNDVATLLHKELDPKRNEIVTEVARVFAGRFTEQELKDLVAFYKSPLGKKVIAEEPLAIDASMQKAQAWADDLTEQVLNRFRVEMKKKGHDL